MERRRITTAMANLYHIGRTTDPCIPQLVPQAWQILALLNADVPRVQLVVQVSRHFIWRSKLSVPVSCSITAQWDRGVVRLLRSNSYRLQFPGTSTSCHKYGGWCIQMFFVTIWTIIYFCLKINNYIVCNICASTCPLLMRMSLQLHITNFKHEMH